MALVRRWADAVMFSGRKIERMYAGRRPLGVPAYQWAPVVDTDRFWPDPATRAATRARMGVPEDAPFVGTVANLVPMKGIEYFIEAAVRIHRRRPDTWFLISGSTYPDHDDYVARLHEEAWASGVPQERFIWTEGPADGVYPALDVMLITSLPRSEGWTTTSVESLACETPVVATDVGSVSEIVIDGVTGTIVPPRDAQALATATLMLIEEPGLHERLGAEGRRRVIEGHSPTAVTEEHVRAFVAARDRRRT
jgi:glycosyltransferase involved in cell wall biosynthesis